MLMLLKLKKLICCYLKFKRIFYAIVSYIYTIYSYSCQEGFTTPGRRLASFQIPTHIVSCPLILLSYPSFSLIVFTINTTISLRSNCLKRTAIASAEVYATYAATSFTAKHWDRRSPIIFFAIVTSQSTD